jgi:glycosyltransferase 2 family protein
MLGIKLLIAAVAFWVIVRAIDLQKALDSLRGVPAVAWVVILLTPLVQAALLGQRWRLISQALDCRMSWRSSFLPTLIGFFFSQGLPASIGSDAFRIWYQKQAGVPLALAVKTVLADRLVGFFTLVGLTVISLWFLIDRIGNEELLAPLTLLALALLGAMILGILLVRLQLLRPWQTKRDGALKTVAQIYNWVLECVGFVSTVSPAQTIAIIGLAVVVHLMTIAITYVAAVHSTDVSFLDCFAAVTPALLVAYLPISIAGWGVREAAVVAGFSLIGVPGEISLPVSLLVGFSVFSVSLLGGAVWIWGGVRSAYLRTSRDNP